MMRVGVLGAAKITKGALVDPARRVHDVTVAAIASRDPERAHAAARTLHIPQVHRTYRELLADSSLDAVYIPLPAALHGTWTRAALDAGKNVLVEKPFTANHQEAQRIGAAAHAAGLVVMEAHHSSHHPFTARAREIVRSGTLGSIEFAEASFCVPIRPGRDIRWDYALGGGGLMDLGCYPIRMLRDILGHEVNVVDARASVRGDIDRAMTAHVHVGATPATIVTSMWSRRLFSAHVDLRGTRARLRMRWPYHPQHGGRLVVDGTGTRHHESADRRSSYDYQLDAFRDAVIHGGPNITHPAAAAATMRTIDEIYVKSGMRVREPLAPAATRRRTRP